VDEIFEQIITKYIFDGDSATIGETFRKYLTIDQITKILEGEYE
jgi:hypothetical protein